MKILAIDLGHARTGLAVSDELELIASPLQTIEQKNQIKLLNQIVEIAKEQEVKQIIIGLPKNMDGSEGESARNAKRFSSDLSDLTGLEVFLQDERVTTVLAHTYLNEINVRGKKRKKIVDTVSAVIILQNYLDFRKNSSV